MKKDSDVKSDPLPRSNAPTDAKLELPAFFPYSRGVKWFSSPGMFLTMPLVIIALFLMWGGEWSAFNVSDDYPKVLLFIVAVSWIPFYLYGLYFGGLLVTSEGIRERGAPRTPLKFKWDELNRFEVSSDDHRLEVICDQSKFERVNWTLRSLSMPSKRTITLPLEGDLGEIVALLNGELERHRHKRTG